MTVVVRRPRLPMRMRFVLSLALALLGACAPPPLPVQTAVVRPPPPPLLEEDRLENPAPEWITGDWATTDRATRARLLAYARTANAWTVECKRGFVSLTSAVHPVVASVDADISAIPASTSPYEAFAAFRTAYARFVQSRDRILQEESLGGWEASFFFQPVEARLVRALVEWERIRDPRLVAAAWTRPLGNPMPVATPTGDAHDDEARFCRRSRDAGTRAAAVFSIPADVRRLVRAPFDDADRAAPLAPAAAPAPVPTAFDVEGVVQSASTIPAGTLVRFVRAWSMLEQRPPCHPAPCAGLDCTMTPPRTVCQEVTVPMRLAFDALFTTLPSGLALQKGDAVAFRAAEQQTVVAPFTTHFHGIVLSWVDRAAGAKTERVYSLSP